MAALWPVLAQSPLPPGRLETAPRSYEVETRQVGGKGWNYYSFVGDLRCQGSDDALVGVRTVRSDMIDYIQPICAPIHCDQNGCIWTNGRTGKGAGNPNSGGSRVDKVCPAGSMISGFAAKESGGFLGIAGNFISDLRFDCSKIAGPGQTAKGGGLQKLFPITNTGALSDPISRTQARCSNVGPTALSVAVGRSPSGRQVVAALSMYCGRSTDTGCRCPSGSQEPPPFTLILTMKDQAKFVFARYDTNRPIGIARVANQYNTYLVALSGTEPGNPGQATWFGEDMSAAHVQRDFYSIAIVNAIKAAVPPGARLILVGHSLGGMEAENVAVDRLLSAYQIIRVITLGSPHTAAPDAIATYKRFAARNDPIIDSNVWKMFDNSDQIILGPGDVVTGIVRGIFKGLAAHMSYPDLNELNPYDAMGNRGKFTLQLDPNCFCTFAAPGVWLAVNQQLFRKH